MSWKDVFSRKSLAPNGAVMSPDGKWVAYGIVPVDGDGELYLQRVGDTTLKSTRLEEVPLFPWHLAKTGND